ncbi:MAG: GTPase Era [Bacteroidota bacterium]
MNALVGERMSIITAKPQTTRHRIVGLLSGDDFQIVFSDTPGIIGTPTYRMQQSMNHTVLSAFEDADIMLLVVDASEKPDDRDPLLEKLKEFEGPKFLVVNKKDLVDLPVAQSRAEWWGLQVSFRETIFLSALHKDQTDTLMDKVMQYLPEGPVYYPKDQLTDRPERFFVSEIIRERILEQYHEEIPYAAEVTITHFKEKTTTKGLPLTEIGAVIYVERESQKMILLGRKGAAVKQLGTAARTTLEAWLEQKVYLEIHVKVRDKWRNDERMLRHFGYDS